MWSAIKSDLFEFVNTIQQDTTTTLNKVLGEEEDDNNQQVYRITVSLCMNLSYILYDRMNKKPF